MVDDLGRTKDYLLTVQSCIIEGEPIYIEMIRELVEVLGPVTMGGQRLDTELYLKLRALHYKLFSYMFDGVGLTDSTFSDHYISLRVAEAIHTHLTAIAKRKETGFTKEIRKVMARVRKKLRSIIRQTEVLCRLGVTYQHV